jgi:hypothetical protein
MFSPFISGLSCGAITTFAIGNLAKDRRRAEKGYRWSKKILTAWQYSSVIKPKNLDQAYFKFRTFKLETLRRLEMHEELLRIDEHIDKQNRMTEAQAESYRQKRMLKFNASLQKTVNEQLAQINQFGLDMKRKR